MKSILIMLFVQNWQRKLISLILAIVIWLMINHSITVTKIDVP
jgi:YbbR domain-containing protein